MCSDKAMLCAVLLITSALVTVTSGNDIGKFTSCCTRVSAAKPTVQLEDFLIQEKQLPCVEAVMFITIDGKILCSKPNVPWVSRKILEISQHKTPLSGESIWESCQVFGLYGCNNSQWGF
ncbi:uncharacterized protein WCC33_003034 [Rhinophrynus dorsalis]